MTYQPKIYRKHGGNEMVVASGGDITVDSGATLNVNGVEYVAGTLSVTGTGTIGLAPGGKIVIPITAKDKDNKATDIVANTINVITCSSTGSVCKLPVPTAGTAIYAVCAARTSPGTYTLSSTKAFIGQGDKNKLLLDAAGEAALIVSASTAWIAITASAGVVTS